MGDFVEKYKVAWHGATRVGRVNFAKLPVFWMGFNKSLNRWLDWVYTGGGCHTMRSRLWPGNVLHGLSLFYVAPRKEGGWANLFATDPAGPMAAAATSQRESATIGWFIKPSRLPIKIRFGYCDRFHDCHD